ncbi:MAG TPA: HEAT repeat domain-containing protein [Methylomirabilota bacterium]|nr:HEAT repeat domain-containing protein [Methylomirabilota bacterium]
MQRKTGSIHGREIGQEGRCIPARSRVKDALTRGAGVLLVALAGRGVGASPLPEPVAPWRLELVAEAPRIRHPSVVACAPDGRVFVAEDPMDISSPRADAAEGRILCLHADGRMTVFAEKLFAVFGLQYLEGRLYVLHNPKFSVFDDDAGVGRNRRDLIEQTLPDPWALGWNDHVPANFRLAMDGFFYVACGDKGLHGAQGTDGSRADLFSGGVFRLRPDGSRLEVFCHGVRNILDVALDAEDEIFTYDNTDEHDWMGRFTHMVEAGFYGYPHDFIPRRPYTLWMMADYGAGAACGALAYTEDALPPEYHGNVFLSDFGKRQIMRVRVEREGGTFRAVAIEDLFPNPPGDFRPVGITLGPDGKSLYICDWQHRDEKAPVNVGRLLRLTWTGPDHAQPKPAWYAAAAMGRPFVADTAELLRGLAHPARSVRLMSQRRLAEVASVRGSAVARELAGLLGDAAAPALARIHALWALHALDGGRGQRDVIVGASRDLDARVRRQAVRQLGWQPDAAVVAALRERLRDADASVRFHAATALGRLGPVEAVPDLLAALEESDAFTRFAVFTALNRIGTNGPAAWSEIAAGLENPSERVREGTLFALRETYDTRLLEVLLGLFRDQRRQPGVRRVALDLVVALHHRPPAWKGEWWAYHPALQPPPAKTESWSGTSAVLAALRAGLGERDDALRRACIEGLAAARDAGTAPALREVYGREPDAASRATILRALGAMKDADALGLALEELARRTHPDIMAAAIAAAEAIGGERAIRALIDLLRARDATADSQARAIAALATLRATTATNAIRSLVSHPAPTVRAAVLAALGRLEGPGSLAVLDAALADPALEVRLAAVKALGQLKSREAVPALLKAHADEALRAEAYSALTRTPDERALDVLLAGLASKSPPLRDAAHLAIRNLSAKVLKAIEARADSLPPQALTELRQIYAGHQEAERGPLFARQIRQHTPEEYLKAALQTSGDPVRGRRLFRDAGGVNCAGCHRVAGEGSDLGPDLSGAGAQFDRRALAEAILYPSRAVREGYQQIAIEMADGEEFSGVIKGETTDTLTLRDATGREHKLPRAAIKSRQVSALSLMPEGLQVALTLEEFSDLIAYLTTLRGNPPAVAPVR